MAKSKDPKGLVLTKETDTYYHYKFKDVKLEDLDPNTFQTVNLPYNDKLIIARNKYTQELIGCQILKRK